MMDKLTQEIWQRDYLNPMFEKYKEIPTKLKYMFIEKDCIEMFGKRRTLDKMRYMYDDSEEFIFAFENALCSFSKVVRKNMFKKYCEELALDEHYNLTKSGMFFEFFPTLSGEYLRDKEEFTKFVIERESNKKWLGKIL